MKRNRMFFSKAALVMICTLSMSAAHATTTKVGNGDDGGDLEALTPINEGPIWASRLKAIELLKSLNVAAIPGMSILIPELKGSELLLAQQDVHPTVEQTGSVEVSDDRVSVYARTFAEPYAATRFFPAALKLSEQQLVSLHIHEALHRALPVDVRSDEDKVMLLTLAMTSPGASFDRVTSIANRYISPPPPVAALRETIEAKPVHIPERSKSSIATTLDFNSPGTASPYHSIFQRFEFSTSLGGYQRIGSVAVEPYFRGRVLLVNGPDVAHFAGPTSLEFQGRFKLSDGYIAPFVRLNAKALDTSAGGFADRDIISFGGLYRTEDARRYWEASAFYSLPSASTYNDGIQNNETKFGSIISVTAKTGFSLGRFRLGALAQLHASQGAETSPQRGSDGYDENYLGQSKPFRLLVLGPEAGYQTERLSLMIHYKQIVNSVAENLDDLGDPMDRGGSNVSLGTSASYTF